MLAAPRLPPFSQSPTATRIRSQRRPSTTPRPSGQPRKEQSPNVVPIVPAIPLDTIERLAAAGLDAQALLVACREIARFLPRNVPRNGATLHATEATLHATKPPKTSTERSREHRARQRLSVVQRDGVAPVASVAPLSKEDISLSGAQARESKSDLKSGLMPLPEDWQPSERSRAVAVEVLGEACAAILTDKFRDHYTCRPQDMRPAAGWQAKFRNWARSEHKRRESPQQDLRLVRSVKATGPPPAPCDFVIIRRGTPEAAALEAHRGKPIPWGKHDTWTVKAGEWPPQQRKDSV